MSSFFKKITLISLITFFNYCSINQNTATAANTNFNQIKQINEDIAATIDSYKITTQDIEERYLLGLQPSPYKLYTKNTSPVDVNSLLHLILAEKAVLVESRKQGLHKDENIRKTISNESEKRIISLWAEDNINKERDRIVATEEEIEKQMEADPKIERNIAKSTIETTKTNKILDECYDELEKKSNIKKLSENISKVISIHERLLKHPVKARSVSYIKDSQIIEDLTEEEKNLPLATFVTGNVTLQDWFKILCSYAPPSRPRNLDTIEGIDTLLEIAISKALIVSDAHAKNLDKNPSYVKQIRDIEDRLLLSNALNSRNSDINEPNSEEIRAFYNANKEFFITGRAMRIDQIWCKDLETAKKVKNEINNGKDFNEAKQQYSLYPNAQPYQATIGNEGYFWRDLWPGKPNELHGPIKGYHTQSIHWRIVKIFEKQQGKQEEYSKELETKVKYLMMSEMTNKSIEDYCLNILNKYPYEIYFDNLKNVDPMNIP